MFCEKPQGLKCPEVSLGIGEVAILKKDTLSYLAVKGYRALFSGQQGADRVRDSHGQRNGNHHTEIVVCSSSVSNTSSHF